MRAMLYLLRDWFDLSFGSKYLDDSERFLSSPHPEKTRRTSKDEKKRCCQVAKSQSEYVKLATGITYPGFTVMSNQIHCCVSSQALDDLDPIPSVYDRV